MVHSLCLGVEMRSQKDHVPTGMYRYRLARRLEKRRWLPAAQAMKFKHSPRTHSGSK